jgi:hypothetical protein
MEPDSEVPVALEPVLEPLAVALDEELPLASVPAPVLVPVELQADRVRAVRPAIRRAWYFFMFTPVVKVSP